VGPGVTSLKRGDRASVAWFYEGCGHCEYAPAAGKRFAAPSGMLVIPSTAVWPKSASSWPTIR
jgi:D-arabinose 1-dehydrogenase-like Zn-dependent alcohol dehydrogenase